MFTIYNQIEIGAPAVYLGLACISKAPTREALLTKPLSD